MKRKAILAFQNSITAEITGNSIKASSFPSSGNSNSTLDLVPVEAGNETQSKFNSLVAVSAVNERVAFEPSPAVQSREC